MLYAVELRFKLVGADELAPITGYHSYSLFLSLIQRANPALAAELHREGGAKPFTLSLPVSTNLRERRTVLKAGSGLRVRLTFLQEEVFAAVLDALWRLPSEVKLPLGKLWVAYDGLATTPAQSPWAAFSSFSELLESAGEERKLRLDFLSPTTFRSKGKRNILFPEPSLVFGSLLSRWSAFAPSSLNLCLGESTFSNVRLSAYRLASRMLDFGTYQEVGFCGQATYELDESLPGSQVLPLHALAAFSFFSGVGAKTTMGMGQARPFGRQPWRCSQGPGGCRST